MSGKRIDSPRDKEQEYIARFLADGEARPIGIRIRRYIHDDYGLLGSLTR